MCLFLDGRPVCGGSRANIIYCRIIILVLLLQRFVVQGCCYRGHKNNILFMQCVLRIGLLNLTLLLFVGSFDF